MDTNTAQPDSIPNVPSETSPVVMNPGDNFNDINSVVNAPSGSSKGNKKLWVIVGILVTLGAVGVATYLVQRESFTQSKAWNCTLYTFSVSESGVVTVTNGSTRNEPPQQARVYINDVLVQTFAVPGLAQGASANLGVVDVPTGESYTWEVEGTLDCSNAGSYEVETSPTPTGHLTPTLTVTTTATPSTTPSVTVTPNPSESPTPTLTSTPGPSSTSTPGPSNTPTPTGTAQGTGDALADAGFGTPTIIGLALGMFLIFGALLLAL